MNKIKTLFRKARYRIRHGFFSIENIVLIIAVIFCLVWTYQSVAAMSRNWELSERLSEERKKLELVTVEVEAAELENEYYQTEEYLELMARRNLDKQQAGEKMVVLPENSDAAKRKHKTINAEIQEEDRSNFKKWTMFLFPNY